MTQEQKARAYDEAIKRAKEINNEKKAQPFDVMLKVFPELKKSEDEKIKETLIDYFKTYKKQEEFGIKTFFGIPTNNILAWLERQGEKKPTIEMITPEESLGITSKEWNEIENECIFGEYKPKFKVGDWITNGQLTCKVLSVTGKSYELHLYNDDYCHFETDVQRVDKQYHLWTIQDAKDGDLLCGFPEANYPWIGIFHELNAEGTFNSYCYLQAGLHGKFCPPSGENIFGKRNVDNHSSSVVPATKEQRDLLFRKMKEDGYEWNAEKKHLKQL